MANRSSMIRINIHITYTQAMQSQFIHHRTMCKTYNSEQLGFINMNIQHINFPSMLLGVLLILSLWLCCRFQKGCQMFGQRHKHQSEIYSGITGSEANNTYPYKILFQRLNGKQRRLLYYGLSCSKLNIYSFNVYEPMQWKRLG